MIKQKQSEFEILLDYWIANQHNYMPFTWLRGRSFSDAFVICLGAGPWLYGRRKTVQGLVLGKLKSRDISELDPQEISSWYPLKWQNQFLCHAVTVLHQNDQSFDEYCSYVSNFQSKNIKELADFVGSGYRPKVISLFCRDSLGIPSFPIDRHVKRRLIALGLPPDETKMINLCKLCGLDPSKVATVFVRTASNMDNPDWSINS